MAMGRPRTHDPLDSRAVARRHAKLAEVYRAAQMLAVRMRHTGMKGLYRIPPDVVLRLCSAIDDADGVVEEGGD